MLPIYTHHIFSIPSSWYFYMTNSRYFLFRMYFTECRDANTIELYSFIRVMCISICEIQYSKSKLCILRSQKIISTVNKMNYFSLILYTEINEDQLSILFLISMKIFNHYVKDIIALVSRIKSLIS